MCIVFYTLNQPGYRLILASNRDEYLDRPATRAHWHDFGNISSASATSEQNGDDAWVLSGRDSSSATGGTWLGMTSDLRIGVITNIRHPHKPRSEETPSRGQLLKDYLAPPPRSSSRPGLDEHLRFHEQNADSYEGFNLLLFDLGSADPKVGYLTNRPQATLLNLSPTASTTRNGTCTNGLSNSPIDKPFTKVVDGNTRMDEELRSWSASNENEADLIERLMGLLSQSVPLTSLADTTRSTLLEPILVAPNPEIPLQEGQSGRWYGTRVSTVILIRDDGHVTFVEGDRAVLVDGQVNSGSSRQFDFVAPTT